MTVFDVRLPVDGSIKCQVVSRWQAELNDEAVRTSPVSWVKLVYKCTAEGTSPYTFVCGVCRHATWGSWERGSIWLGLGGETPTRVSPKDGLLRPCSWKGNIARLGAWITSVYLDRIYHKCEIHHTGVMWISDVRRTLFRVGHMFCLGNKTVGEQH